mmetsp:Transcript_21016/g.45820  ORF Transcript_21016/g.45820 Transcript_21016/m.45820 type:complete len:206 (-) Transcript_21016:223-840(-)
MLWAAPTRSRRDRTIPRLSTTTGVATITLPPLIRPSSTILPHLSSKVEEAKIRRRVARRREEEGEACTRGPFNIPTTAILSPPPPGIPRESLSPTATPTTLPMVPPDLPILSRLLRYRMRTECSTMSTSTKQVPPLLPSSPVVARPTWSSVPPMVVLPSSAPASTVVVEILRWRHPIPSLLLMAVLLPVGANAALSIGAASRCLN